MTSETNENDMLSKRDEKITMYVNKNEKDIQNHVKIYEDDSQKQISPDSTSQLNTNIINTKQPTRILPFVLVQAPSNIKVPSSLVTVANSSSLVTVANSITTPLLVNASLNSLKQNTNMSSVVLNPTTSTNKTTQIILQKTGNGAPGQTLIPVSVATSTGTKQTFAYLGALVKNNGKAGENQILVPTNQLPPGLVKTTVKSSENQLILPNLPNLVKSVSKSENTIVVSNHLPAGLVPTPNNQKLVLTPMTMPKLATRLPATYSTNCINQPKIANIILPMSINQMKQNSQSVINFKIANGQIQSDSKGSITVLCDNTKKHEVSDVTSTTVEKKESVTEVIINSSIANNPPKLVKCGKNNENNDKQYELSIPEEPKSVNYTIKLSDDMKTYKIEKNGQEVDAITTNLPAGENKSSKDNSPTTKEPKIISRGPRNISRSSKHSKSEVNNTPSVIVHPKNENHRKAHEASILKKCNITSYNKTGSERKTYSKVPIIPKNDSSITITAEKPAENTTTSETKVEKKVSSERRRKSQYTYIRDFDEIVVTSGNAWEEKNDSQIDKYSKRFESAEITFTKLNSPEREPKSEVKKIDDFVEIEVIKQEFPQFNTEDVKDIKTALEWKDGVGTLPGSKIKFHVNEYGLIELLTEDSKKDAEPSDNDILNCRECGCYGMPSEFISKNYCSLSCKANAIHNIEKLKRDAFLKDNRAKKRKFKYDLKKHETEIKNYDSDEASDLSQDNKVNYPWQGGKKGFSWAKYLSHVSAKAAPIKLFKDPYPYNKNGFRVGMKLEGIDPQHPSYYCVMTVAEVQGYRIRLHFDGYSDSYDFWTNADSMDIFPMGWCEKFNHNLHPPPGHTENDFNWTMYLKNCKATAAPRHLFSNRAGNSICPNGFRLGMKLEAVDRKNSALVCVATVTDLMDNRFLVHFDSWDDIYDYWADPSSPYIHPVGWCDKYGHSLTPPNDYPNPSTFTWESYLKQTKSSAAPARAFKQRPRTGFKRGMRLECVDKRTPQLIRVATVDDILEHKIRIRFDGWPDKYSYWVDDDSTDIHPAGWCQKTGHPLEGPLMPADVYENFDECPTVGCRGIGHILGALYEMHNCARDCPYSDENLIDPPVIPDRLNGLRGSPIKAEPVQREPKTTSSSKSSPSFTKAPKIRRLTETDSKQEWPLEEDSSDSIRRRKTPTTRENSPAVSEDKFKISEQIKLFKTEFKTEFKSEYTNPSQKALEKHTKYLDEIIGYNSKDPRLWTHDDVCEFVNSIPSCKDHSKIFVKELIDGEALLMLTQKDLVDILKFKLGPAIKLYNSILLLRKNVNLYN